MKQALYVDSISSVTAFRLSVLLLLAKAYIESSSGVSVGGHLVDGSGCWSAVLLVIFLSPLAGMVQATLQLVR